MVLLIVIAIPSQAEQFHEYDSTIDSNSFYHLFFTVLRDLDLTIEGITDGTIEVIAMDDTNFIKWEELLDYAIIYNDTIVDDFMIQLTVALTINSTLHLLFINSATDSVNIQMRISEKISTVSDSNISIYSILISTSLILIIYRKLIRKRLNY
ncbi:MAG: hypothetical protein ACW99A_09265 [Candidatus Kariarchaeaceae archaeon]